jgi:phytanoyl-CoA hydroxylase
VQHGGGAPPALAAAQVAADVAETTPETPGLSPAQLNFFRCFGFLHLRGFFTAAETASIQLEVEKKVHALSAQDKGSVDGITPGDLLEGSAALRVALLGERPLAVAAQLFAEYETERFIFTGSSLAWSGFADDEPKVPTTTGWDDGLNEHGWHSDIPGPSEASYPRIKCMVYLTPTTRDRGAVRFIPGSHTAAYQQSLKSLQGYHMVHTALDPAWAAGTFGTQGRDVPATAIEATPGDFVLFHHSLYHAVYNHQPDRRLLQFGFVGYPDSAERLASLWRHPDATLKSLKPQLLNHANAKMRSLAFEPEELERLRAEAEAAHLALPFPEADVSVYGPAQEHRERTGMQQWRERDGVPPASADALLLGSNRARPTAQRS